MAATRAGLLLLLVAACSGSEPPPNTLRTRAPLGRRYFVVTEGGRITSMRSMLPTQRGRDTFEVLDTTSNKFSLAAFTL